ncbi:MAG: PaaI family thioesterase [Blastocatellia bacterium]
MTDQEHQKFQSLITESNFARLMDFQVVEKRPGHVRLRLPFHEHLLQALGRIHGGAIFALADHASGWAAATMLTPGDRCATLEMKINYIGGVKDEDCIAEARVVHSGRTSIVVEAEVRTGAGKLVAKTLATFMVLKRKPDEAPAQEQDSLLS